MADELDVDRVVGRQRSERHIDDAVGTCVGKKGVGLLGVGSWELNVEIGRVEGDAVPEEWQLREADGAVDGIVHISVNEEVVIYDAVAVLSVCDGYGVDLNGVES